jgi:hypothetical protein
MSAVNTMVLVLLGGPALALAALDPGAKPWLVSSSVVCADGSVSVSDSVDEQRQLRSVPAVQVRPTSALRSPTPPPPLTGGCVQLYSRAAPGAVQDLCWLEVRARSVVGVVRASVRARPSLLVSAAMHVCRGNSDATCMLQVPPPEPVAPPVAPPAAPSTFRDPTKEYSARLKAPYHSCQIKQYPGVKVGAT